MTKFQLNNLPQLFEDNKFTTVLHNSAKSLFCFYAIYEQIYDALCLISNIHNTILGGILEGFFNNNSNISKKVGEFNNSRRLHYKSLIIDDIQQLGKIFNSYQFHSEAFQKGISVGDMQTMLIDGDLVRLKVLIHDNNDNDIQVEESVTLKLETIKRIEQYPLYVRKILAYEINRIAELTSVDAQKLLKSYVDEQDLLKSYIQSNKKILDPKDGFIKSFQENFNKKCSRSKPDQIIKKIISEAIKVKHKNLVSLKKIEKGLFSFGKEIGKSFRIDSSNEENQLKQVLELIVLVTIYVTLYLEKFIKNLIFKPVEILKFILLGFIYGVDEKILPEKHDLDKMLIDFKNPINELVWSFHKNYEHFSLGNDKFEYAAGKKCPIQVLEKLIATKTEYLIRKQNKNLDEVLDVKYDDDVKADVGRHIPQDNPIAWLFAGINTLDECMRKLAVTLGNQLGSSCKSFYHYVSSRSNNQQHELRL